jgi:hypothetical protein
LQNFDLSFPRVLSAGIIGRQTGNMHLRKFFDIVIAYFFGIKMNLKKRV